MKVVITMVSIAEVVGYVLAIAFAKLIMYIIMKIRIETYIRETAEDLSDVADNIDDETTRNVIKEIAWYVKNKKTRDKTSLLEDVKKHVKERSSQKTIS